MGSSRLEINKFDGHGDFNLWQMKMRVILVQHKCIQAPNEVMAAKGEKDKAKSTPSQEMKELQQLAFSLLILSLSDNVLRQVSKASSAAQVWLKLESLYMAKSLSNKIHLKDQLFTFKINPAKSLEENIDVFNEITISLANIDEEISEENQAILLLNSLPESHNDLKTTMKYGRQTLTLEDVLVALRSRDLELKKEKRNTPAEGLQVRGKPGKKSKSKGKNHSRSKSKDKRNSKTLVC